MIANKLDGSGLSYYTMGDRKYPGLKTYFDNIRDSMSSVAALADADRALADARQDRWNPFHVGEDLVTTFLALTIFSRHAAPVASSAGSKKLWNTLPTAYSHASTSASSSGRSRPMLKNSL